MFPQPIHPLPTRALLAVFLLGLAVQASAWSLQCHRLIAHGAVDILRRDPSTPPELLAWVETRGGVETAAIDSGIKTGEKPIVWALADELTFGYWAVHPDLAKNPGMVALPNPWNEGEAPLHYIDLEFWGEVTSFQPDLSARPPLSAIPEEADDCAHVGGFLPWRAEQSYDHLVAAWASGDDKAALEWGGYLAHYVGDAHQPHHGTVDYQSYSFFSHLPRRERPGLHSPLEGGIYRPTGPEFDALRARFAEGFLRGLDASPAGAQHALSVDTWATPVRVTVLEVIRAGYEYLPLIGRAGSQSLDSEGGLVLSEFLEYSETMPAPGVAGTTFARGESVSVVEMKARQMSEASHVLARLLRQAWADAEAKRRAE